MTDPLLSKVNLKSLQDIIAAARETIHRHRRRFLQRNLRPCALNCKGANTMGYKVIGCGKCGTNNPEACIQSSRFEALFTKEELGQQFADQLRNPEVLLREYRDVTVFLWVLGAFDKQTREIDEHIVSKVEQRDNRTRKMAVGQVVTGVASGSGIDPDQSDTSSDHRTATSRVENTTPNRVPSDRSSGSVSSD